MRFLNLQRLVDITDILRAIFVDLIATIDSSS